MAKKTSAPTGTSEAYCGLPQVSVEIPHEIAQSKRFVQESMGLVQDIEALQSRIQGLENRLLAHKVNLEDAHAFAVGKLLAELEHMRVATLRTDDLYQRASLLRSHCTTALGTEAYDKINA